MILLTGEEMEVQMVNKFIQGHTALRRWSWCSRTQCYSARASILTMILTALFTSRERQQSCFPTAKDHCVSGTKNTVPYNCN